MPDRCQEIIITVRTRQAYTIWPGRRAATEAGPVRPPKRRERHVSLHRWTAPQVGHAGAHGTVRSSSVLTRSGVNGLNGCPCGKAL